MVAACRQLGHGLAYRYGISDPGVEGLPTGRGIAVDRMAINPVGAAFTPLLESPVTVRATGGSRRVAQSLL